MEEEVNLPKPAMELSSSVRKSSYGVEEERYEY